MKKIISMLLILVLGTLMFVSCGDDNTSAEKEYKLAIGVAVEQSGAKVTNTVAAIVTDADGKIVSCRIDCIDVQASLLEDGTVDATKTYQSKAEQGDAYNMVTYGGAKAEWYAQAKAVETYVTGKTQDEVKAIALGSDGKPTDAELSASCTIAINSFTTAIDNAFKSAHKASFKTDADFTVGVAVKADVSPNAAKAKYVADFAASVMAGGKVLASVIDSNQVDVTITDGSFEKMSYPGTKLEQGDNYNMVAYGGAKAEWYAQAKTFANASVGKTLDEVKAIALDNAGKLTDAEFSATCTIAVSGYKAALEAAIGFAR